MKECTYCGREHEDLAPVCGACGTEFAVASVPPPKQPGVAHQAIVNAFVCTRCCREWPESYCPECSTSIDAAPGPALAPSQQVSPDQGVRSLAAQLQHPEAEFNPLLRRLKAGVSQWQLKPGLVEADLVLQRFVADDEESTRRSYSLIRTFVWALPAALIVGLLSLAGFFRDQKAPLPGFGTLQRCLMVGLSGLLLGSGCTTTKTIQEKQDRGIAHIYDASFEEVWEAIPLLVEEEIGFRKWNLKIQEADKSSGRFLLSKGGGVASLAAPVALGLVPGLFLGHYGFVAAIYIEEIETGRSRINIVADTRSGADLLGSGVEQAFPISIHRKLAGQFRFIE